MATKKEIQISVEDKYIIDVERFNREGLSFKFLIIDKFFEKKSEDLMHLKEKEIFEKILLLEKELDNAENPENNFLPETGTMFVFEKGLNDYDTRWDSGISSGSKIGTNFDPMLAKVISHANSRVDTVNKLAKSLEDSHIGGVITNKDFLIATLRSKEFLDGNTTTDFIDKVKPETKKQLSEIDIERALAGATLWLQEINRNSSPVLGNISSNWTNITHYINFLFLYFINKFRY